MDSKPRLITVDDDAEMRAFVRGVGTRLNFDVSEVSDPGTFRDVVVSTAPDVIVLDLSMPGADGITLMRQLQATKCKAKLIFLSGCDPRTLQTVQELAKAYGLNTLGYLRKPPSAAALEAMLVGDPKAHGSSFTVADLEKAIYEHEIIVHYQPKVHRRNERWVIESMEALARWQHPDFGMIPPNSFIPMAESSGLIGPLTESVFAQAIEQTRNWAAHGLKLNVAVNLSPLLVPDLELPDRVRALLEKYQLEPSCLTIEVTESAAISDSRDAMDVLARLRVLGVSLAIDDFGTGSSSLVQLFRLPFNELKIDRCFVDRIPESEEAKRIVQATVDLAHSLGLVACAEGVEQQAALDFLRTIGCEMAQGYLISKPLPAEKLLSFIQQWSREPSRGVRRAG